MKLFKRKQKEEINPALKALADILDADKANHLPTKCVAVQSCIKQIHDQEIQDLLRESVDDANAAKAVSALLPDGTSFLLGGPDILEALCSEHEKTAEMAAKQFGEDCVKIRNAIRCKYAF